MTRTLKVLGLGLFAALAMSAFAVLGASASETAHTGGHFTLQSGTSATLHGHTNVTETETHRVKLHAFGQTVECTETYTGSVNAATVTSVTITPHYTECAEGRTVHMNGCTYTFQIRQTNASTKHSPVSLVCPGSNKAVVTASGCVITFGSQTITSAATYTTALSGGVHAITADITATGIKYEKHGLCEFLSPFGTGPHTGAEMTGAALLKGSSGGVPVGITATGTNGS